MKVESRTFFCDVARCKEVHTVTDTDNATVYLSLVEAGWKVKRSYVGGWKHVCTTHTVGDLK